MAVRETLLLLAALSFTSAGMVLVRHHHAHAHTVRVERGITNHDVVSNNNQTLPGAFGR
jgi:hypothetical protein